MLTSRPVYIFQSFPLFPSFQHEPTRNCWTPLLRSVAATMQDKYLASGRCQKFMMQIRTSLYPLPPYFFAIFSNTNVSLFDSRKVENYLLFRFIACIRLIFRFHLVNINIQSSSTIHPTISRGDIKCNSNIQS